MVSVSHGLWTTNMVSKHALPSFQGQSGTRLFAATGDRGTARQLVYEGMQLFKENKVEDSIQKFDQAEKEVPDLHPFLWQRGLSLYYADRFDEASQQFRDDVHVNPNDVEEIVWDIASQMRLDSSNFPVKNQLSLPGKDRRPIMSTVYRLFRGEATEQELALAGHKGSIGDEFYALMYLGLFCECRREMDKAASYMRQAIKTSYATRRGSGDYMVSLAKVRTCLSCHGCNGKLFVPHIKCSPTARSTAKDETGLSREHLKLYSVPFDLPTMKERCRFSG